MPSKARNKGSGFEREVAKYLSEVYGAPFTRAPGSGAYTGGSNSHRRTTLSESQVRSFKGDIMPPENFPKFNAEAKFYADFAWHQLYTSCPQLDSWLDQLMQAADPDDLNILFMKINRRGRFVAVQATLPWNFTGGHTLYQSKSHGNWMIYSLENFFSKNKQIVQDLSSTK
jgi:hypothetical protein